MTFDPAFLTLSEALAIHRSAIEKHGGRAGVRDMGLLESALAMPRASFGGQFVHADPLEMAAAYLFHIVQNHPFVDGNKRVGAVAALVFLELNGFECRMTNDALFALVLSVAKGETPKGEVAGVLRKRSRPLRP